MKGVASRHKASPLPDVHEGSFQRMDRRETGGHHCHMFTSAPSNRWTGVRRGVTTARSSRVLLPADGPARSGGHHCQMFMRAPSDGRTGPMRGATSSAFTGPSGGTAGPSRWTEVLRDAGPPAGVTSAIRDLVPAGVLLAVIPQLRRLAETQSGSRLTHTLPRCDGSPARVLAEDDCALSAGRALVRQDLADHRV